LLWEGEDSFPFTPEGNLEGGGGVRGEKKVANIGISI